MRWLTLAAWSICCCASLCPAADEPPFSGPQVGEALPEFKVRRALTGQPDEEFDLLAQAQDRPVLIIFVHEATRPSLGLVRAVMKYAASRQPDGLHPLVVFLTADATASESFVNRARHALPADVPIGISRDGQEGPGAYGLNRQVGLTVLVGKERKVTANFALVQPSLQADAPKILAAVVQTLGSGQVPTLAELGVPAQRMERRGENEVDLRALLRPVLDKSASEAAVTKAAAEVDRQAEQQPAVRQAVGRAASRIIQSGKLADYGTPAAQAHLERWAKAWTTDPPAPKP
jgi:hypothetical protein